MISLIFLAELLIFAAGKPFLVERAFIAMGAPVEFKIYCEETKDLCNEKIFRAYEEVKRLDDMLSNYKPDSDLSEVNSRAGGDKTPVPPEFFELLGRSIHFSEITDGAFDVTVGRLVELWKEGGRANKIPLDKRIEETVSGCVGSDKVELYPDKSEVRITSPCLLIDFGGIGKGYAVDRAASILKAEGIKSAIINFSGNIYAIGSPPSEKGWKIGIKHPIKEGEFLGFIEVKDAGVSTSGDYERYNVIEGKRYSHIVDPRTGVPAASVPSVTVVSKGAADADALSTAFSVLGKSGSKRVLRTIPDTGAMIITRRKGEISIYRNKVFKNFEVSPPN